MSQEKRRQMDAERMEIQRVQQELESEKQKKLQFKQEFNHEMNSELSSIQNRKRAEFEQRKTDKSNQYQSQQLEEEVMRQKQLSLEHKKASQNAYN